MHRIARGFLLGLLVCMGVLFVTGCKSDTPRGYVAKQWALTMREMGINPIFPPREDVQVGDVYVYPITPGTEDEYFKKNDYLPLDLWIGTVDLRENEQPGTSLVSLFYKSRPIFPITPDDKDEMAIGEDDIYCTGEVRRLRQVGMPVFMSTTLNQGDLSAVIPIQALNIAFGTNYNSSKVVTLKIPRAESYALPADEVRRLLFATTGEALTATSGAGGTSTTTPANNGTKQQALPTWFDGQLLWSYANAAHQVKTTDANKKPTAYFIVITEVYYAREIDLSVQGKKAQGAALAAELAVPGAKLLNAGTSTAVPTVKEPPPGEETTTTSDETEPDEPATDTVTTETKVKDVWSPIAVAEALNNQMNRVAAATVPSGNFKFISVSDNSVAMKAEFKQPIAIGYRGFYISVTQEDKDTYVPRLAGVVSTAMPTAADEQAPDKTK